MSSNKAFTISQLDHIQPPKKLRQFLRSLVLYGAASTATPFVIEEVALSHFDMLQISYLCISKVHQQLPSG